MRLDPPLSIRAASPEDEPFLRRLFAEAHCAHLTHLPLAPAQLEAMVDMQYRARGSHYSALYKAEQLIVLDSSDPVGGLLLEETPDRTLIVDIALFARARGKGIGTKLIQSLQEKGLPLELTVATDNPAQRLYERLGFVETAADPMNRHMKWMP